MRDVKKVKKDEKLDLVKMALLEEELKELKKEQGIKTKEGRLSHAVSSFFERRDAREAVLLQKKKYILLAVLTGWMGGHRFYAKQWKVGLLYLVLCWSGFSIVNTIVDLMVIIPKPADEHGMVLM